LKSVEILLPQKVEFLTEPYLAVCEGHGDARFICALIRHKQIPGCAVGCPSKTGWPNIPEYLKGIKAIDLIRPVLHGLIVIADSDEEPDQQFQLMRTALDDAEFPVPTEPFSIEGDPLRTAVFIMPRQGQKGTLEHVLLEATFEANAQLKECVDTFLHCTGNDGERTANQLAKMRMSSLIGAFCAENPWSSLAFIWSEKGNPVPITSTKFNHISDFLIQFCK
jgi:hypothetical protein